MSKRTTYSNLCLEELSEKFSDLSTRSDVAALLGIRDIDLCHQLYVYPLAKAYTKFEIPKKSGGVRFIYAPKTSLKILQMKLNDVFSSVYRPKPSVHGFTSEKGIITNAQVHLRQKYILNIDLENFFPSINFGRVRGLLMAAPYHCTPEVATVLAQICCFENQLPQGSPTSPIISNMICAKLDTQLQRMARKNQCTYTRYADDITFSTSRKRFPPKLARFNDETETFSLGRELEQVVNGNGFLINYSKVRLQSSYMHQEVTGITVNERLNVPRKYIRQIRAVLHAWETYGLNNAERVFWEKYKKNGEPEKTADSFRSVIRGRIEFVGSVRGREDQIYLNLLKWFIKLAPDLQNERIIDLLSSKSIEESAQKIIVDIWTEGKTDALHLKAAFKHLEENLRIRPNFLLAFRNGQDETREGSSELIKLCEQYCKTSHGKPIVAIFDRDEQDKLKKMHDDAVGFKEWGNGIYSFALPVPRHRNENDGICIEMYYTDEEIRTEDAEGRRLYLSTEFSNQSGRNLLGLDLVATNPGRFRRGISVLDSDVYDHDHKNVALSKNDFSRYVFDSQQGFHDFNFDAFVEVFNVVEKIIERHTHQKNA